MLTGGKNSGGNGEIILVMATTRIQLLHSLKIITQAVLGGCKGEMMPCGVRFNKYIIDSCKIHLLLQLCLITMTKSGGVAKLCFQ